MDFVLEVRSTLNHIKQNKIYYGFLFIQLIYFSGLVRQFGTDWFLVINIFITAMLCLFSRKLTLKNIVFVIKLLVVFTLINVMPAIAWGYDMRLLLGFTGRLILGALIVIYLKNGFYEKYERLIFILALISIPLYIIQLTYVQSFDIFRWFSETVLSDERLYYGRGVLTGHRYLLVYLVNSWGEHRNSGFMWEPAAFGAVITWAIIINMIRNNFKLNPILLTLLVVGVTTFSRGMYIYLALTGLILILKNHANAKTYFILLLIAFIFIGLFQVDFVTENINEMLEKNQVEALWIERIQLGNVPTRASRVGGFFANITYVLQEPFGYGLRSDIYMTEPRLVITPNGFMDLLRNWGLPAFAIILVCANKFIMNLLYAYFVKINVGIYSLFILLLVLPINGNPFVNQPFLFSILFSGYLALKE